MSIAKMFGNEPSPFSDEGLAEWADELRREVGRHRAERADEPGRSPFAEAFARERAATPGRESRPHEPPPWRRPDW